MTANEISDNVAHIADNIQEINNNVSESSMVSETIAQEIAENERVDKQYDQKRPAGG